MEIGRRCHLNCWHKVMYLWIFFPSCGCFILSCRFEEGLVFLRWRSPGHQAGHKWRRLCTALSIATVCQGTRVKLFVLFFCLFVYKAWPRSVDLELSVGCSKKRISVRNSRLKVITTMKEGLKDPKEGEWIMKKRKIAKIKVTETNRAAIEVRHSGGWKGWRTDNIKKR